MVILAKYLAVPHVKDLVDMAISFIDLLKIALFQNDAHLLSKCLIRKHNDKTSNKEAPECNKFAYVT